MSDNVTFGIASGLNASFDHMLDSGWSREDWDELTEKERDQALADFLWENVEVWVVDE